MAPLPPGDEAPPPLDCDRCSPATPATVLWQSNTNPAQGIALCDWCDQRVGSPLTGFTRLRR